MLTNFNLRSAGIYHNVLSTASREIECARYKKRPLIMDAFSTALTQLIVSIHWSAWKARRYI